ncbi:MAG: superoxide dismutase, partial [Opitutales bacterium]|nr:superoxide dismutase [Opitutales bacterium]
EIREAVKNNGGGVWNHEFYWSGLSPEKTGPSQALKAAAQKYFGSFDEMKAKLADASVKRFGSGWGWLIKAADGSLKIVSTPNQDCPLMAKDGSKPLLCIDVWEHAYYLKYKNMRASYVAAILDIVNWAKVSAEYES